MRKSNLHDHKLVQVYGFRSELIRFKQALLLITLLKKNMCFRLLVIFVMNETFVLS